MLFEQEHIYYRLCRNFFLLRRAHIKPPIRRFILNGAIGFPNENAYGLNCVYYTHTAAVLTKQKKKKINI